MLQKGYKYDTKVTFPRPTPIFLICGCKKPNMIKICPKFNINIIETEYK